VRLDNTIAGIKTLIRAECRKQPLVIQIEDAHWLDEASLTAVRNLTYNMDDVPLALVLTSRPRDDGSLLSFSDLGDVPQHRVNLNRLSNAGVQRIAEAILEQGIRESLATFISSKAEGNPFFSEQLALDLRERNLLIQTENGLDLTANAEVEIPSGLNALLIARLDRLSAQVKLVVQTAAVLGREFEVQILLEMLQQDQTPYIRAAEREAIWTALDELRYLFRHALLRDAAYQMQIQDRLKALHRVAAEAIETLYPGDESQDGALMEHWHIAGIIGHALPYTLRTIERLTQVTADYSRAEHLIERALAYDRAEQRAKLLTMRGDAARLRGQFNSAQSDYQADFSRSRRGLIASGRCAARTDIGFP